MVPYEDFDEKRVKHLEMLQGVVGRLGNDSFLVKGWAVTLAGVFVGFAVNKDNGDLALASLLPSLFLWGLDAHFLRSECLFRALYETVVQSPTTVESAGPRSSLTVVDRSHPRSQTNRTDSTTAILSGREGSARADPVSA